MVLRAIVPLVCATRRQRPAAYRCCFRIHTVPVSRASM